jgi:ABC-type transport system substrate-binding protein
MELKTTFVTITMLLLIVIFGFANMVNVASSPERRGPVIDQLRFIVVKSPDDQVNAMTTNVCDVLTDLEWPAHIEYLGINGFTITEAPGYHIDHIGINLRKPVLDDVAFRHALLHGYPQEDIIATYYGYTATPIDSLVAPTQFGYNPNIPKHPYNHGDIDSPPGEESVFGILYEAGYTYHGSGYGDLSAYWLTPEGDPIPDYALWTPLPAAGLYIYEPGQLLVDEWHRCGLNTLTHEPAEFYWYLEKVFDDQDFDMYVIFWSVGRFPDQLFDMCHSSQDVPGGYNAVGLHDPVLDPWVETVKFSLDIGEWREAAYNAQAWMYNPDNPWAFPYLHMQSRNIFNAFDHELAGIVNSMGYGSWNDWTLYNIHWDTLDGLRPETGDNSIYFCNGDEPESLNPFQAITLYEWNIINPTQTGLIQVNPYTHREMPWVATDWLIEGPWSGTAPNGVPITDGMKITYTLRDDVYWQDGEQYKADDAKFSLEFLRDNAIPKYTSAWTPIVYVEINNDYSFTVYSDTSSLFYFYDWAGLATLLPPQVWAEWDGEPLQDILGYEVWKDTRPTGPTPTPTRLFGLGPMIFQGYDEVGMYADLSRSDNFFKTTAELQTMLVEMWHQCGDVNYDGIVDDLDMSQMSYAYGYYIGEEEYDADCDLDSDGFVGPYDITMISFYFGETGTYPA